MIASMLARSGSGESVVASTCPEASGLTTPAVLFSFSLSFSSLSKTWVASSSSSQSISILLPARIFALGVAALGAAPPAGEPLVGGVLVPADTRVFGGGGTDGKRWVAEGLADAAAASVGCGSPRFGKEPRPGGGGGSLLAVRMEPEGGGGTDGGTARRPVAEGVVGGGNGGGADLGGVAIKGSELNGGRDAGPGIPSRVLFASVGTARGWTLTCVLEEPGGAGGAVGERSEVFFPRPSKMSRSEPPLPLLLSFDIPLS